MRDLVLNFPPRQKVPVLSTLTLASGSFASVGSGTFTLSRDGVTLASGAVSGNSTSGLTLTEWIFIDGTTLSFTPGIYILEFSEPITPSDTLVRTKTPTLILNVPGKPTSRASYPTGDDLQVILASAEILDNPPTASQMFLDLDGAVNAAIREFEEKTRFLPFLGDGTITTRTFRSEGKLCSFLHSGLISLDSGADAITTGTVNYTPGSNVELNPLNAAVMNRPYTRLKFVSPNAIIYSPFVYTPSDAMPGPGDVGGRTITLGIRGKWGFSLSLPDDAYNSILDRACAILALELALAISGGIYEQKRNDYTVRYAGSSITPLSEETKLWQRSFDSTARFYAGLAAK